MPRNDGVLRNNPTLVEIFLEDNIIMAVVIKMPKFGLSMEEGRILSWIKKEGDFVTEGESLVEVETEKITNTVEAPVKGVLRKILAEEGATLACGQPIAVIATADEDISELIGSSQYNSSDGVPSVPHFKITPKAKTLADEYGLDYSLIKGQGIGGAITRNDVKKYLAEKIKPVNEPVLSERTSKKRKSDLRKSIAGNMLKSIQTTAQTTMVIDADVTELVTLYRQMGPDYKNAGIKLSYTGILIKITAEALKQHPLLRTFLTQENLFETAAEINVGFAVNVEGGIYVPVIKNADVKNTQTICHELDTLAKKAREGRLSLAEVS
ncbi:MAG: dihydrolipoamide acetyltransferase family protein, partial [Spirochaetota bacterium]